MCGDVVGGVEGGGLKEGNGGVMSRAELGVLLNWEMCMDGLSERVSECMQERNKRRKSLMEI